MEIYSELFGLDTEVYKASEPIENFRCYRYQRRLLEPNSLFGKTDHLAPGISNIEIHKKDLESIRKEIKKYSPSFPAHIPQHYIARILKKKLEGLLDSNDKVYLGTEFLAFKNNKISGVKAKKIVYPKGLYNSECCKQEYL